jgi:dipeptidyl aminopeptidase/acylaminoacyl peptidase
MRSLSLATVVGLLVLFAPRALGADGDILEREVLPGAPESPATVERVIYESDGLRILGYLAYPKDAPALVEGGAPPLPCLIFNRGGNRDFGVWTPERFARFGGAVAGWGYIFFASNYRGSPGSEGAEEFGGADVNDVINALRVFDQLPFADAERIGMWGHSRGGMMTYLALTRTDRIDAAVVGAGVVDLERMIAQRPEMETGVLAELVPGWPEGREEALAARSAVRWVERLPDGVPVLIMQGTADWRVDPRDALDMAAGLQAAKKPYRLIMFEGADHSMTETRGAYRAEARAWLDRYVRDGGALPNLEPHGD